MPAVLLVFSVYGAAAPADAQPAQGQHAQGQSAQGQSAQGRAHASTDAARPAQGTAGSNSSGTTSSGTTSSGTAAPKTADGSGTFDRPNDWQAKADPDGMDNGGVDQPGGTGGTIGSQDGNNGSGNDADCEDDNRGRGVPGHCKDTYNAAQPAAVTPGQPAAPGVPAVAQAAGQPVSRPAALPAEVLGISAIRPRTQPNLTAVGQVAGISASLQPSAGVLPNTGAGDSAPLGAAGVVLLAGGAGLLLWRRRLAA
jgi:LPXTG-motif cell wall-anchored protein